MISGFANADGADLYFERRGSGPALLLIVGGGGDCGYYSGLADLLSDACTVVTYDRRGNSRSPLQYGPVKIDIAEQSADALAVLRANDFASARVFGNSGGATIALDLAAHHPRVVDAVVAHEPPIPKALPDAGQYLAIFDEIDRVWATEGWQEAFITFQTRLGLVPREVAMGLLNPALILPPGPMRDLVTRVSRNWEYMITYEVRPFVDYLPDLDRIVHNQVRIALGCGAATTDSAVVQMCVVCAERLGAECVVFPRGPHRAFGDSPGLRAYTERPLDAPHACRRKRPNRHALGARLAS